MTAKVRQRGHAEATTGVTLAPRLPRLSRATPPVRGHLSVADRQPCAGPYARARWSQGRGRSIEGEMTDDMQGRDDSFPIEVLEEGTLGRWKVTTESGAAYDLDLRGDGTSRVSRQGGPGDDGRPMHWRLLHVWMSQRAMRGEDRSLLLGDRMVLVMEPVAPGASYSVIVSAPVTRIRAVGT